jgi:hypothetical protein
MNDTAIAPVEQESGTSDSKRCVRNPSAGVVLTPKGGLVDINSRRMSANMF